MGYALPPIFFTIISRFGTVIVLVATFTAFLRSHKIGLSSVVRIVLKPDGRWTTIQLARMVSARPVSIGPVETKCQLITTDRRFCRDPSDSERTDWLAIIA